MKDRPTAHEDLISVLMKYAQEKPDDLACVYLLDGENEKTAITFSELDRQARAFAATLQKISRFGDRALLLYPSGLDFIVAFFGCLYAGVVAVPTTVPHLKRSTPRLKLMMDDAGAAIACTTQSVYEKIKLLVEDNPEFTKVHWVVSENIADEASLAWHPSHPRPDDIAFLQYTSGSTSFPKGVMITHNNLLQTIRDITIGAEFNEQTVMVSWLPIFHDMGLIYCLLSSLYSGRPCYIMSPVSFLEKPVRWLKAMSTFEATHTAAPNFAFDLCTRKITEDEKASLDLGNLKSVLNAAEPVRWETMKDFANAFKGTGFHFDAFTPGYGLAESTVKVSTKLVDCPPSYCSIDINATQENLIVFLPEGDPNSYKVVNCGVSSIGADIKIVNYETGSLTQKNEIGEIWIHSKSVAKGYWQNPEASKAAFQAMISNDDIGPFLRTGDMGFMHENELYITGRIKDMIIIQGKNYYPQDIELTVEKCHPALRPGCGAALAIQEQYGEKLVVVQEIKREYRKDTHLDEVSNKIRMAVAKNHGLRILAVTLIMPSTIEKTTSGKIQRSAVRESFLHGNLEILHQWHALDMVQKSNPAKK